MSTIGNYSESKVVVEFNHFQHFGDRDLNFQYREQIKYLYFEKMIKNYFHEKILYIFLKNDPLLFFQKIKIISIFLKKLIFFSKK